ncbi:hypothetical protein [Bailinhaonella thermotolerans]|uniref:Secreted protein n=1 Tax=Bailinhaonella thermotolerans TaxID=1070861 RepID=A0A3A4BL12_9ACTN|nr:hypothetical protein [Bailinhaonella thermotolerans]RJL31732.1 hypothetical protein D5H75_18710 [Bailinhaonella thermotolerans]
MKRRSAAAVIAGASAAIMFTATAAYAHGFDQWFNGSGESPRWDVGAGKHSGHMTATCPGAQITAQLYRDRPWRPDPPIGSLIVVPCNHQRREFSYDLSGGKYYFIFRSKVRSNHVWGEFN